MGEVEPQWLPVAGRDLACRPAGLDGEQGRQLRLPRQWKGGIERAEDDAAAHTGPGQQQVGQGAAYHGGEVITGLQARQRQLLAQAVESGIQLLVAEWVGGVNGDAVRGGPRPVAHRAGLQRVVMVR